MSVSRTALVALGSNLGDRLETCRAAVDALDATDGIAVAAVSPIFETAPVGGPAGQDAYYNAAVALRTTREPLGLLGLLQAIEAQHKRAREVHWGPRTLDLDLLFLEDAVWDDARLTLPHPRLHERRFVLAPLARIAPDQRHPVIGQTVAEMLAALPSDDAGDVVAVLEDWRCAP